MLVPVGEGGEIGGLSGIQASGDNEIDFDIDEIEKIVIEQSQAIGMNMND